MKKLISCLLITLFSIIILLAFANTAFGAEYTAEALLKVLPYVEQDPMSLESPPIDEGLQNRFCESMVELAGQQSLLLDLLKRDRIRETEWFRKFGRTNEGYFEARSLENALIDLRKNLKVSRKENSDFLAISMTCDYREESAIIANQFVDVFIRYQQMTRTQQITDKLRAINESRNAIERELTSLRTTLDNIRKESGFFDFEDSGFPNPVRVRLNRLLAKRDDCMLEITELESQITILENNDKKTEAEQKQLKETRNKLQIKQNQLKQLEKMCTEAEETKRSFDSARISYQYVMERKSERIETLKKINFLTEKLHLKSNSPDTAKVQKVGDAPMPR